MKKFLVLGIMLMATLLSAATVYNLFASPSFFDNTGTGAGKTAFIRIPGAALTLPTASGTSPTENFQLGFCGGTTAVLNEAELLKMNKNSLTVLSTTTVTFGGSANVNQSVSGSTVSAPTVLTSDKIGANLGYTFDVNHDYIFAFDIDTTNTATGCTVLNSSAYPQTNIEVWYVIGDHTADNPIPSWVGNSGPYPQGWLVQGTIQ